MKQRHRKRQRALMQTTGTSCQPQDESTVASLDEGLSETFPASDPVSVSVTRIEDGEEVCRPADDKPSR